MKPQIVERDIRTSGIVTSQKMRIAEGSEHIIFNVLRTKMYKDKLKSIWREYLANAQDEHVRLKKVDVPFEVTFPNSLSPTMKIRDFGRGLSDEQVLYFFGQFGASDKRDTNDLIGCFGLGNKVGNAYTDSFVITSFFNGQKSVFNVFIGQDNRGDIVKLGDSTKTDEPNGVEISIGIQPKDIGECIDKGVSVIKYLPTRPIIKGLSYAPDFGSNKLMTSGNGWRYYTGHYNDNAVCMMGGIAYEIDSDAMGFLQDYETQLLESNLHIDVAIGDIDVTSSREDLEMTDRTKDAVKKRLKIIRDEMLVQTQKDLANAKTEFEARVFYYNAIQNGGGFGRILRNSLGSKLKWNGIEIDGATISLSKKDGSSDHQLITYTMFRGRRKSTISHLAEHRLVCTPEIQKSLYYDDTDGKVVNYKRRAKTLFDASIDLESVWIIKTTDPADFEKRTGLKVSDLKSYNAIVPTFVSTATGGNGPDKTKRKKHQTRVFELDLVELNNYYTGAASDSWKVKVVDLDTEDGLYIWIDRFKPTNSFFHVLRGHRGLSELINNLQTIGIKIDKPIYGLKTSVLSPGKLKHFDEWVKEQIEAVPNLKEDYALGKEYSNGASQLDVDPQSVKGKVLECATLLNRAKESYLHGNLNIKAHLCSEVGIELPAPTTALKEAIKEVYKDFPLLKYISKHHHRDLEVVDYLNTEPLPVQVQVATV